MVCSDKDTASESEEFVLSSSSVSDDSDTEPSCWHRGVIAPALPDLTCVPAENYSPQVPDFTASSGLQFNYTGFRAIDFFTFFFQTP